MSRKFYTPIDLTGLELQNGKIQNLASDPTPFGKGHIYFNTVHNEVRVYDGTAWQPVGGAVEFGPDNARPVAGNPGRLYVDRDNWRLLLDNGFSWDPIGDPLGSADAAQIGAENFASQLVNAHNASSSGVHGVLGSVVGTTDPQTLFSKTLGGGTTLGADLDAAGHKVTGLNAPLYNDDAATKFYVDNSLATDAVVMANKTLGSGTSLGANLIGAGFLVKGLGDPLDDQDAANKRYVDGQISAVVGGAPALLNTLKELADALNDDPSLATNLTSLINTKQDTLYAGTGLTLGADSNNRPTFWVNLGAGLTTDSNNAITFDTANGYGLRRFAAQLGDGYNTSFDIYHNFNTSDVVVSVYDAITKAEVFADVTHTSDAKVNIEFAEAPSANQFRVVIIG